MLPAYQEEFVDLPMETYQEAAYRQLASKLTAELHQAVARRDTTLLGMRLSMLLAWPDCRFRPEVVKHLRTRDTLARVDVIFDEDQASPKEALIVPRQRSTPAIARKPASAKPIETPPPFTVVDVEYRGSERFL